MTAAFGSQWSALDLSNQWSIINAIRTTEHQDELFDFLVSNFDITLETAEKLSHVKLEDGYGRLGETASKQILYLLKQEVITYSDAASRIYGSHSDDRTGEILEELPYYGEILQRHIIPGSMDESQHDPLKDAAEYWGRITNPTVHIGLNQLRKLVNDIIQTYGKPNRIVVELARDLKNSEAQKKRDQQEYKIVN
jgi:CRISPR-associated endonuclease Csn1